MIEGIRVTTCEWCGYDEILTPKIISGTDFYEQVCDSCYEKAMKVLKPLGLKTYTEKTEFVNSRFVKAGTKKLADLLFSHKMIQQEVYDQMVEELE